METNYSQSQNIQVALAWMIQREEYLKSSKSQHCHSTKLTVHPSSQLYCVFISANCCYCSSIGIIYCIVGILAVLCLHPSSRLYCVFILHLSCTVSSSLPTVHPFSQLHCVFISANSCWCSSIGRIYCNVGILAVLCLHLYHLLPVFFNWNDPTDWIVWNFYW